MGRNTWMIHNGRMIPQGTPAVPAGARTVLYGDGCFETFRSAGGRFLHFDDHLERLGRGLDYLAIPAPDLLQRELLGQQIGELLERNDLLQSEAMVRLQVWREGGRGYVPDGDEPAGYTLMAGPLSPPAGSVRLVTVPVRRIPAASLAPDLKLSGGTHYIRAAVEARERKGDDALMLTAGGAVSETTVANIFWVEGRTLCTPADTCDLLPGITRSILLALADETVRLEIRRGHFPPEALHAAEAVSICNSLLGIQPVSSVDSHPFDTAHPIFEELGERFRRYREVHSEVVW